MVPIESLDWLLHGNAVSMHPISNRRPSETKLTYVEDLVDLPFHVAKGFHPEVMVRNTAVTPLRECAGSCSDLCLLGAIRM